MTRTIFFEWSENLALSWTHRGHELDCCFVESVDLVQQEYTVDGSATYKDDTERMRGPCARMTSTIRKKLDRCREE